MVNRRLIRSDLDEAKGALQEPAAPRPRRKAPPPEVTHAEAFYYVKQIQAATRLTLVLTDGEMVEGILEWYDQDALKLRRTDAPDLMIMKHAVRYIYKPDEPVGGGD